MFLMIDNYDSFVYNLVRYFEELEQEMLVYRNDDITIEQMETINPRGIVLSPGPKDPAETGICQEIIRHFSNRIPVLGVCLGHQTIAHVFGANIVKGKRPMHGKVTKMNHTGEGILKNIPSPMNVTRYHSLVVEEASLPEDFWVTGRSEDGVIMALKHKRLLLEGVQFHPEAVLTEYGHALLENYIDWCKEAADNEGH